MLDNKLSQNIRLSHKLYWENHENLESGTDSRREKLRWNKDLKRHIPRRCTITITIYNCDDVTQPHTQKMYSWVQTYSIAGKDKSMYMDDIKLFAKNEKGLKTLIHAVRIVMNLDPGDRQIHILRLNIDTLSLSLSLLFPS